MCTLLSVYSGGYITASDTRGMGYMLEDGDALGIALGLD